MLVVFVAEFLITLLFVPSPVNSNVPSFVMPFFIARSEAFAIKLPVICISFCEIETSALFVTFPLITRLLVVFVAEFLITLLFVPSPVNSNVPSFVMPLAIVKLFALVDITPSVAICNSFCITFVVSPSFIAPLTFVIPEGLFISSIIALFISILPLKFNVPVL